MKLLYKFIDYLDSVVCPYIKQMKTYKKYKAWVKYEIMPYNKKKYLKLWVAYEETDEDGFIESPIIDVDFTVNKKIRFGNNIEIYLEDKEEEELIKLLKEGIKKINGKYN